MSGCAKCAECANFDVGEPHHHRLKEVCPLCETPILINDRYTIARKLSGNRDVNADVFEVFDRQRDPCPKDIKSFNESRTPYSENVQNLFRIWQRR